MKTVYAWKFIIPSGEWRTLPDTQIQFRGCLTIVLATTEEFAKNRAKDYAAENGFDPRWIDIADIKRILPVEGGVLTWVEQ